MRFLLDQRDPPFIVHEFLSTRDAAFANRSATSRLGLSKQVRLDLRTNSIATDAPQAELQAWSPNSMCLDSCNGRGVCHKGECKCQPNGASRLVSFQVTPTAPILYAHTGCATKDHLCCAFLRALYKDDAQLSMARLRLCWGYLVHVNTLSL